MTTTALARIWIKMKTPSRSVSVWMYPRRKRRTLPNLHPRSRGMVRRAWQAVHQQRGVGRGVDVAMDVAASPAEVAVPMVLERSRRMVVMVATMRVLEVVRTMLGRLEWQG